MNVVKGTSCKPIIGHAPPLHWHLAGTAGGLVYRDEGKALVKKVSSLPCSLTNIMQLTVAASSQMHIDYT